MEKKNIERIEKHLDVLKKSYDNIVEVMEEDIEKKKDEKTGKETIVLKDDKIKTYADGVRKCAETLNYLYSEINEKEEELEKLTTNKTKQNKTKIPEITKPSNLNNHLNNG